MISGQCPPAVYRFTSRAHPSNIVRNVESHGWRCFHLDAQEAVDKASFLATAAGALHFPSYFGSNWDAFEECLTDMSWAPAPGYVVLVDEVDTFVHRSPTNWRTAFAIFDNAIQDWKSRGIPMYVLLRKAGRRVGALPKL